MPSNKDFQNLTFAQALWYCANLAQESEEFDNIGKGQTISTDWDVVIDRVKEEMKQGDKK